MKKLKFITLAIAILGFTSISFAQTGTPQSLGNSASINDAKASATIITPITLANTKDLDFGIIVGVAATITMPSSGVRTSDNLNSFASALDGSTAAAFTVSGEAGAAYSIIVQPTDIKIKHTNNTDEMTVSAFEFTGNATNLSGTAGSYTPGTNSFKVGAKLAVLASQKAGVYSGTYNVTVSYN